MHPISFGIPEQHVVDAPPPKTQDFPAHVIDPEVAARVGGATSYAFADQDAYYADLRASRFGVTIKREGGTPCATTSSRRAASCSASGSSTTSRRRARRTG